MIGAVAPHAADLLTGTLVYRVVVLSTFLAYNVIGNFFNMSTNSMT